MLIRTPDGAVDVRALQQRAAQQLGPMTTDDVKMAITIMEVLIDELEARDKQLEDLRQTMIYKNNI